MEERERLFQITERIIAAAMRVHPAMFVPLIVILLSAAIAYFALTSVSIRVNPPRVGTPQIALGAPAAVAVGPSRGSEPRYPGRPGQPGGPVPGDPPPGRPGAPTPKEPGGENPSPSPSPAPSPSPSSTPSPGPGRPGQPPFPAPSPAPSSVPLPSPTGSGSSSGSGGGLCVNVGPLGVCLKL